MRDRAVLEEMERRLIAGHDPLPLLATIRWPDLIDWPRTLEEAKGLKRRLADIGHLIRGLQAPLRATLMGLNQDASYEAKGMPAPKTLSVRFHESA